MFWCDDPYGRASCVCPFEYTRLIVYKWSCAYHLFSCPLFLGVEFVSLLGTSQKWGSKALSKRSCSPAHSTYHHQMTIFIFPLFIFFPCFMSHLFHPSRRNKQSSTCAGRARRLRKREITRLGPSEVIAAHLRKKGQQLYCKTLKMCCFLLNIIIDSF